MRLLVSARQVVFAVAAAFFLVTAAASAASSDDFSGANAINNRGVIGGASCTPGCGSVSATLLDARGWHDFGTLGGFAGVVFSVSDSGIAVGQADTAQLGGANGDEFVSLAFKIGNDGVLQSLGALPGYQNSQAYDVNNHGEVVGWSYNFGPFPFTTAPGFHAFHVGTDGVMRDLGTLPGGSNSIARAISNSGRIVGASRAAGGARRAVVWEQGAVTALPGLGGVFEEALDLNERGEIVGSANPPGFPAQVTRAVLWTENGQIVDLGTLGGTRSRAWGINARGDIVGEARLANNQSHAFLYRDGVMKDLGTLGGTFSAAFDINDAGEIVGVSQTGVIGPFGPVEHGFVVGKDGIMRDIGTLP